MALHCFADSSDLAPPCPSLLHVHLHASAPDTVRSYIRVKPCDSPPWWSGSSWCFSCSSETALRHLQDLGLEVSLQFLKIFKIIRSAETFRKFSFVQLSKALVPETAYIQPNLAGRGLFAKLEAYFQGSHKQSVVDSGKLGAPKTHAVMVKYDETSYEDMVDRFPCTTAIGVPSPAV